MHEREYITTRYSGLYNTNKKLKTMATTVCTLEEAEEIFEEAFGNIKALYSYEANEELYPVNKTAMLKLKHKTFVSLCSLCITLKETRPFEFNILDKPTFCSELEYLFKHLMSALSLLLSEEQLKVDKMYKRQLYNNQTRVSRNKWYVLAYLNTFKRLAKIIHLHNIIFPNENYFLPNLRNTIMNQISYTTQFLDTIIKIYNYLESSSKPRRSNDNLIHLIYICVDYRHIQSFVNKELLLLVSKKGTSEPTEVNIKRINNVVKFLINIMKNGCEKLKNGFVLNPLICAEFKDRRESIDKELIKELLRWTILRKNVESEVEYIKCYLDILREDLERETTGILKDLFELLLELNFRISTEDTWMLFVSELKVILGHSKFNRSLCSNADNEFLKEFLVLLQDIVLNKTKLKPEMEDCIDKLENLIK